MRILKRNKRIPKNSHRVFLEGLLTLALALPAPSGMVDMTSLMFASVGD